LAQVDYVGCGAGIRLAALEVTLARAKYGNWIIQYWPGHSTTAVDSHNKTVKKDGYIVTSLSVIT
jgi:hypothetical protein